MNKLLLALSLSLFSFYCNAGDLRISMAGNGNGKYLNNSIQLLDQATYDANSKSVVSTGNNTAIKINSVDLGDKIYIYNSFYIEYTNPKAIAGNVCFDIYLEDSAEPVASVLIEQTVEGEYKELKVELPQSIFGKHDIYVRWRGHSASIKTFGANELKPLVEVPLIRSFSTNTFKFSKAALGKVEGMHQLKMLWRNQNAIVKAVYLDKISPTSVADIQDNHLEIANIQNGFKITSAVPIGKVELYSLSGSKVHDSISKKCLEEILIGPGAYIVKITNPDNQVLIRKILVYL